MSRRLLNCCSTVFMALFLSACSSLFFFPLKEKIHDPSQFGIEHEQVYVKAQDDTLLSAWLLKTKQEKRRGVVYFLHGNAENISTHFMSVYWLPKQGYDVLLLDYRGFGASKGHPSLPEVYWDIDAGFTWLQQRYSDETPHYFLGQSIGATLGIYWLSTRPDYARRFNAVVLDSPFPSYSFMVRDTLQRHWLTWLFAYPVSWGFSSRYDVDTVVDKLSEKPVLFFHSRDDQIIPFVHSEEVFRSLKEPKQQVVYSGPHIATFNDKKNRHRLVEFFAESAE